MWPLKSMLFFGLFWVACAYSLFNPIYGILAYVMVYQLNPMVSWWGIPMVEMGTRFSLIPIVFTIAGLAIGTRHVPSVKPMLCRWEIGVLLLILIGVINTVIGIGYNDLARLTFDKLWKMLIFVLLLTRIVSTRRNLHIVIWALVAGCFHIGWQALHASGDAFVEGRLEYLGGSDFFRTSGLAAHLSGMLPIVGVAFLISRRWVWKAFAAFTGALTVNAIIMCRTRSAFIGLCAGALVAIIIAPRARRFRIHAMVVGALLVSFSLGDDYFWDRMASIIVPETYQEDVATTSRFAIWHIAFQVFLDHPLGIGAGNFINITALYNPIYYSRSSHNTFLACLVELGIQGIIVFLVMLGGSLAYLRRSSKLAHLTNHDIETRYIAYGLLIALVTYVVTGLGTERFYCESFWWVLALPLCLYRAVAREANAAAYAPSRDLCADETGKPWREVDPQYA